eukprot:460649-Amphidinium_carterae.1
MTTNIITEQKDLLYRITKEYSANSYICSVTNCRSGAHASLGGELSGFLGIDHQEHLAGSAVTEQVLRKALWPLQQGAHVRAI